MMMETPFKDLDNNNNNPSMYNHDDYTFTDNNTSNLTDPPVPVVSDYTPSADAFTFLQRSPSATSLISVSNSVALRTDHHESSSILIPINEIPSSQKESTDSHSLVSDFDSGNGTTMAIPVRTSSTKSSSSSSSSSNNNTNNNTNNIAIVRKSAPKMGTLWSAEEEQRLINELAQKTLDLTRIAALHQRTIGGIMSRLRTIAVRYVIDNKMSCEAASNKVGGHLTPEEIMIAVEKTQSVKESSGPSSTRAHSIMTEAAGPSNNQNNNNNNSACTIKASDRLIEVLERQHWESMKMMQNIIDALHALTPGQGSNPDH